MAEPDLPLAPEIIDTPAGWVPAVFEDFDEFLRDHASCEKKASGMALNMASHYPDQPLLLNAMVELAVEELSHYREVVRILLQRKAAPGPDLKDPYINQLNRQVRKGPANFLLDRLLVASVVERRGAERFGLLAAHIVDPDLAKFYADITASETRHWTLFLDLAMQHCEAAQVAPRFAELTTIEGEIMLDLPLRPALH
jgi:tRNA-(ms[2]io[6]A)-hydroxylase